MLHNSIRLRLLSNVGLKTRRGISTKFKHLTLLHEVITVDEEKVLESFLHPILSRKRYEGNHWDDVISKYKELELTRYKIPEPVQLILTKMKALIERSLNRSSVDFLPSHVIDLAEDGHIGAHVDSIKFSGDFIGGLSISSQRTIKLDYRSDTETDGQNTAVLHGYPPTVRFLAPRRSLYLIHGPFRYNYAHAVSGVGNPLENESEDDWVGDRPTNSVAYERRISVMFRNAKE